VTHAAHSTEPGATTTPYPTLPAGGSNGWSGGRCAWMFTGFAPTGMTVVLYLAARWSLWTLMASVGRAGEIRNAGRMVDGIAPTLGSQLSGLEQRAMLGGVGDSSVGNPQSQRLGNEKVVEGACFGNSPRARYSS
jgi:hypothetical protein